MLSIKIGSVELKLLFDGEIKIRGDRTFYPASRKEWSAITSSDGNNMISAPVRPLLIDDPRGLTLVDTGLGNVRSAENEATPVGQVFDELSSCGTTPEDIRYIILTHGHSDHILGNTIRSGDDIIPAFSNAQYIIQKEEAEYIRSNSPGIWELYFFPIEKAGQLKLIEGDTRLSDALSCRLTRGHSIANQSVVIESKGEAACYMGDVALRLIHLKNLDWVPKWAWSSDDDKKNKQKMISWGRDTGAMLILCHDPDHPLVKVKADGKKNIFIDV